MQNSSRNRCSNYNNMDEIKYFYNNKSPSIYSRKVGIKMARKCENQKSNSKSSRQIVQEIELEILNLIVNN